MEVSALSSLYETEPVGVLDQPAFLNLALGAHTDRRPHDLLRYVKDVERRVGRRPTFRWGPRVVDVDIVLFDDCIVDSPDLVIPHPEMAKRAFVLVPLAEIAPDVVHPILMAPINELLRRVSGRETVRMVGPFTGGDRSGHTAVEGCHKIE